MWLVVPKLLSQWVQVKLLVLMRKWELFLKNEPSYQLSAQHIINQLQSNGIKPTLIKLSGTYLYKWLLIGYGN